MKNISELTFQEMVQTLHKNYQLYDLAADAFVKRQSGIVEDEMHDFEEYCDWFEIGADAYIPAISVCQEQYNNFINGIMRSMLTYGFLGSHEDLIRRLWAKADRFQLTLTGHMEMSESTLYTILKRLEEAKMLVVRSTEFEGRLRKYYHITPTGSSQLTDRWHRWVQFFWRVS